jgi:hypothetical protein
MGYSSVIVKCMDNIIIALILGVRKN